MSQAAIVYRLKILVDVRESVVGTQTMLQYHCQRFTIFSGTASVLDWWFEERLLQDPTPHDDRRPSKSEGEKDFQALATMYENSST